MLKRLLCAAAVCFSATPAAADVTGNDIYDVCKHDPKGNTCQSIVISYAAPLTIFYSFSNCIPDGVNEGQLKDIFLKDIMRYPETRHHPALILYQGSMAKAFGCPNVLSKAINFIETVYKD